jgi:F-type H+-transporting ATPase subunit a
MAAEGNGANSMEVANLVTFLVKGFGENPAVRFIHRYEDLFFSALILLFLLLFVAVSTRKRELIPGGLQNFMEWVVESINRFFGGILGKHGEPYLPYVGSLFLYIFVMNMSGLIPGMKSPTTNLNTTVALALTVFITVQYTGIRKLGVGGYLYHLLGRPQDLTGYLLVPLMFPLNLVLEVFLPPVSLSLRLFGNIFGEDTLIGAMVMLGVAVFAYFGIPGGFPFQIPFMLLSALLGTIQALIFSLLASVYILSVLPHEGEHYVVTEEEIVHEKGGSH